MGSRVGAIKPGAVHTWLQALNVLSGQPLLGLLRERRNSPSPSSSRPYGLRRSRKHDHWPGSRGLWPYPGIQELRPSAALFRVSAFGLQITIADNIRATERLWTLQNILYSLLHNRTQLISALFACG